MMRRFTYPVELVPAASVPGADPAETGFVVTFPDLPEAITQGETEAEALSAAADCLDEAVAARLTRGLPLPAPSRGGAGTHYLSPGVTLSAKAALALRMAEEKVTKVALAARLGIDEKEVRRLLDPAAPSKLTRLEAALAALGSRLVVELEPAARVA
jgi:antitoxin HicB